MHVRVRVTLGEVIRSDYSEKGFWLLKGHTWGLKTHFENVLNEAFKAQGPQGDYELESSGCQWYSNNEHHQSMALPLYILLK